MDNLPLHPINLIISYASTYTLLTKTEVKLYPQSDNSFTSVSDINLINTLSN